MSQCKIQQTTYLRTNSTIKDYISESSNDFDDNFDDVKTPTTIDNENNAYLKTTQTLDDLLDIDKNEKQTIEDTDETENDDDDDGEDSTRLSIDDPSEITMSTRKRQKKSNKKKGKLQIAH